MPKSDQSDPDVLDSIINRTQKRTVDRLEQQMQEAGKIKAREQAASDRRLEDMWLREHERQRALAQTRAEQRRQEQKIVRYVLLGAAIFVVVVVLLGMVLNFLV
jgi:hypothetical protein